MKKLASNGKVVMPFRNRPERELPESADMLNLILGTMEEGVEIVAYDYVIRYQNKLLKDRFGDLTGKQCYVEYMGLKKPCPSCPMRKAIKYKKTFRAELTATDGRDYELISMPLEYLGGHVEALGVIRDITERRQAEKRLRGSEEKFRLAFENAKDAILWADPATGLIINCNKAAGTLLEKSRGEIIGYNQTTIHPPEKSEYYAKMFKRHLEKEGVVDDEAEVITKSGKIRTVHITASVTSVAGKPVIQGIFRDVTKHKQVENELKRAKQEKEDILNSLMEHVIYEDTKMKILWANQAACESAGLPFEELVGRHCYEIWPKRSTSCPDCPVIKAMEMGQPQRVEKTTPDGRSWFIRGYPVLDANGEINGAIEVTLDMTERNEAEEALRESEEKYRRLFEEMMDAIFLADAKTGIIVDCNSAASELVGREKSELIDKHQKILHPSEEIEGEFSRTFKQHLTEKEGQVLETQVITEKGVIKDVAIRGNIFEFGGKRLVQGIFRDITDRKKREEALRISEEKTRRLLEFRSKVIDTAVVWIDLLDEEGNLILWNRAAEFISGYSREEVIGHKKVWKWLYPDPKYRAKIFSQTKKLIENGERHESYHTTIRCKDGTLKTISWYSNNIFDKKGKPVGLIGVGVDTTGIAKAEQEIRESEEKYRNLFENAGDVIVAGDLKGKITNANKAVEEYGFQKDEIIGKNMLKLIPKNNWPTAFKAVAKTVKGKPVEGEIEIITPKGTRIAEYRTNPIRQGKKIVGFETILRDITERREMEEKLRQYSEHLEQLVQKRTEELLESEKRYSVLVEEAGDGVVILQDGKIVFSNERGLEIVGYSRDELIGLPFEKLVDEKHRRFVKKRFTRRIGHGEQVPAISEFEVIAKTGEHIPVETTGTIIRHRGEPADLVIMRDIRDRKRVEEEHLMLEKLATIGKLATMVAHDMRNPLTSIRNASFYLKNTCPHRGEPGCKTAVEMLEIIEQETLFANSIISDLLDFAVKKPLQRKKQSINKLIDTSLIVSDIPENIKVRRKLAEKAIAAVDEKQLKRVFLNTVKNAVQAMPKGGNLTIKTNERKDQIEIAFTDTGIGIREENMGKLFQPLFTTKAKGIGMGLAICKRIVEQHRGTINVKSKIAKGTTFTINLPKDGGRR